MAVVKSYNYTINGEPFRVKVVCDSKGEFSIDTPQCVRDRIGVSCATGASLKDVEDNFRNVLNAFALAQTTTRKVICYKLGMSGTIERDGIRLRNDGMNSEGISVTLTAGVYTESKTQRAEGKFHFNYKIEESAIPLSVTPFRHNDLTAYNGEPARSAVEWTPQREALICRLGLALENIVLELQKIEDIEGMMNIADSGKVLQLTP